MRPQAKAYFEPLPGDPKMVSRLHGLERLLRPDQISFRWPDRLSYGRDSNSKATFWVRDGKVKYPPHAVVWPENTKEVSRIASFAQKNSLPLVPFGGGSGVCGGTWALKGGIALDLKRMDKILQVESRQMQVKVQTGINGEILERQLNRRNFTLGHFPSSLYAATLGGFLACRSAGQYSTQYGKIEDMVEGMEVVLANGKVVHLGQVRNRPRALDLKEVFLGSEGVLGILTQATLKVHPLPEEEFFFGFSFDRLENGIGAVRTMLQRGLKPALVRLYDPLDALLALSYQHEEKTFPINILSSGMRSVWGLAKDFSLKVALKNPPLLKKFVDLLPGPCLLILGFRGLSSLLPGRVHAAQKICEDHHGKALGEEPGKYWLKHRYSVSYKLSPIFDQGFVADTLETATTWDKLLPLYREVRKALSRHALVMAHFSHAYPEGCSIYFTFMGYQEDSDALETWYDKIWQDALAACLRHGGTISHHHGVGVLKAGFMREEWGEAFSWLCRLKKLLDPKGILNPGKLGLPE